MLGLWLGYYSRRHAPSKSPPTGCNAVETEESNMVAAPRGH